jgi:hypothetical protein
LTSPRGQRYYSKVIKRGNSLPGAGIYQAAPKGIYNLLLILGIRLLLPVQVMDAQNRPPVPLGRGEGRNTKCPGRPLASIEIERELPPLWRQLAEMETK